MIELPPAVAGRWFDNRREMVAFVAPHRANNRDFVDGTSHMREPIGNWNARFAVTRERAQARNDRTLHRGQIVAKPNRIDEFARPFVMLGIEGVDVTDPAAHEEKNDRPGLRGVW